MKWQSKDKTIGINTDLIKSYRFKKDPSFYVGNGVRHIMASELWIDEGMFLRGEDAESLYFILVNQFGTSSINE